MREPGRKHTQELLEKSGSGGNESIEALGGVFEHGSHKCEGDLCVVAELSSFVSTFILRRNPDIQYSLKSLGSCKARIRKPSIDSPNDSHVLLLDSSGVDGLLATAMRSMDAGCGVTYSVPLLQPQLASWI